MGASQGGDNATFSAGTYNDLQVDNHSGQRVDLKGLDLKGTGTVNMFFGGPPLPPVPKKKKKRAFSPQRSQTPFTMQRRNSPRNGNIKAAEQPDPTVTDGRNPTPSISEFQDDAKKLTQDNTILAPSINPRRNTEVTVPQEPNADVRSPGPTYELADINTQLVSQTANGGGVSSQHLSQARGVPEGDTHIASPIPGSTGTGIREQLSLQNVGHIVKPTNRDTETEAKVVQSTNNPNRAVPSTSCLTKRGIHSMSQQYEDTIVPSSSQSADTNITQKIYPIDAQNATSILPLVQLIQPSQQVAKSNIRESSETKITAGTDNQSNIKLQGQSLQPAVRQPKSKQATEATDPWNSSLGNEHEAKSPQLSRRDKADKVVEPSANPWKDTRQNEELQETEVVQKPQRSFNLDPSLHNEIALASLEVIPISNELSAIVKGAKGSLDLITPWCEAKTDHPVVVKAVTLVRNYGRKYCEAVNVSIETAQDCHAFSHEIVGLCDQLLDEDTTEDSLREYIFSMKDDARACHERTEAVRNTFQDLYGHVLELSKTVPDEVVRHASAKSWSQKVVTFLSWNGNRRSMDPEEIMKELHLVATDLASLSENVTLFAKWWGTMVTKLGSLEVSMDKLKVQPGTNGARIKRLKADWENMERKYEDYNNNIATLVHSYPQNLLHDAEPEFLQISTDLSTIVSNGKLDLGLINSWYEAMEKTTHSDVLKAITIIQDLGRFYCSAINLSVEQAMHCCTLSKDRVDLCEHLLDCDATEQSLVEHLNEVKVSTGSCYRSSEAVQKSFLKTYDEVLKRSELIPQEVVKPPASSRWRLWGGQPSIHEVMNKLHLESPNFERLSDNASAFAQWWWSMATRLSSLDDSINQLKPQGGKNSAMVKILKKDWDKVRRDFEVYHTAIDELNGRCPQSLIQNGTHNSMMQIWRPPARA